MQKGELTQHHFYQYHSFANQAQ